MKAAGVVVLLVLLGALALAWAAGDLAPRAPADTPCAPLELPTPLPSDEAALRAAMEGALRAWAAAHPHSKPLRLGLVWAEADWAAGEVHVAFPDTYSSEGALLLAERAAEGWEVHFPGEPSYLALLERGPARHLPRPALEALRAQSGPAVGDTSGLYYLPYSAGTSVLVTCVDCYPGHFPSVDLYSLGDRILRAARDGTVAAWRDVGDFCCCQSGCGVCNSYLVLDHGDGEYSAYLHLVSGSIPEPLRQIGAFVPRATAIGIEGDVGYSCGSNRPEVGCGSFLPTPGQGCGRHVHFEVRDAPYPYGQRLRPRFQDVYEQTEPPTYYLEEGRIYVSGNLPPSPTPLPTPTPTPAPTPTPGACNPPAGSEGVYLFSEARFCGYFHPYLVSAPAITTPSPLNEGVWSISLFGPYTATLFTAPDYQGIRETFLDGDEDLSDNPISTETASLRVQLAECPVISPGLVLYTSSGYSGACRRFGESDPDLEDDGLAGSVRSLRLVGPYTVTLYAGAGYTGPAETFASDVPDLLEHPLGRNIRSFRLGSRLCNPQAEGVTVFALPSYAGACRTLVTATADLSSTLGMIPRSIWLQGPFHAVQYAAPGFTGTQELLLVSDPDLTDNPAFPARSLQVVGGSCLPWREGVTLFAGSGFSGGCLTLRTSDPDLSASGLAGHVGSIRIRGPYRLTLYALPGFAGPAEQIDRSDPDLSDNPVGVQAASVQLERIPCNAGHGGVTLWAQPGYDGVCTTLRSDDADLGNDGIGRENAFSLRIIGPYSVTLYSGVGFTGTPAVALGDLPDLGNTPFAGSVASARVRPLGVTPRLWNDLRPFALPLQVSTHPAWYLQETGYTSSSPDDPVLSCTGSSGTRTLWYRVSGNQSAVLHAQGMGLAGLALALWTEGPAGLRELACGSGETPTLQAVMLAGRPVWLEASIAGPGSGTLALQVWQSRPFAIYLPLVVRGPSSP